MPESVGELLDTKALDDVMVEPPRKLPPAGRAVPPPLPPGVARTPAAPPPPPAATRLASPPPAPEPAPGLAPNPQSHSEPLPLPPLPSGPSPAPIAPPPAPAPALPPAAADDDDDSPTLDPRPRRSRTITRDLEALLAEAPPRRARPAELVQSLAERGQAVARTAVSGARDAVRTSSAFARSLVDAARTVIAALRENRRRRREISTHLEALATDKERLAAALGDLGRAARAAAVEHPALADELAAIKGIEDRVADAGRERDKIDQRRTAAASKYDDLEAQQRRALAEREESLRHCSGELQARLADRAQARDQLARVEGELKDLSRQVGDLEAQILKAEGREGQSELRREAESRRTQGAALEPERDELSARLATIESEVGGLEGQVTQARTRVEDGRRALEQSERERRRLLTDVDTEAERREAEIGLFDREIARHCVTLGNLCQQQRDELPQFIEAYRSIDTLSERINDLLTAVGTLREEIHESTLPPFRTGVIVLGSGALVVLLVLGVLLRLLLR